MRHKDVKATKIKKHINTTKQMKAIRPLLLSLTICLLSLIPARAQTVINAYQPGVTPEGAIYFLPKTAIRVTVQVEKTSYQPGDFCKYADKYLRLRDVQQEPATSYRITRVSMTPIGLPDKSKAYAVQFNARSSAANVALSDDGVLLAVNAEPTKAMLPAPFVPARRSDKVSPRQFMTEEILTAGSTAKMAELTAREIYDLRENHNLLIKGQADFMPKDGDQLRLMLSQLEEQDQSLTSLFKGITIRDTTEQSYVICPDSTMEKRILFRLSLRLGLVDSDDLSGTPYYISIDDEHSVPPVIEETNSKKKKKDENGLYVNVPGRMRVTLYNGNDVMATEEMAVAQFGHVELLSGELFNKRWTTHLWLSPSTGAVERLEAEQPK